METEKRRELIHKSKSNRKLTEILENTDGFLNELSNLRDSLNGANRSFCSEDEAKVVEGRDISVCVRVRPMLDYEREAEYFETVIPSHRHVHTLEPGFDVRKNPRSKKNVFDVDFAFGPEHDNQHVYDAVTADLIDLGLKGGVCTMLAYGQTGSGKTFTISGILQRIGADLFGRQTGEQLDGDGASRIKIHLSFFELLGNAASDLLDEHKPVEIAEDKFGKIVVNGAREIEIHRPEEFSQMVLTALKHRRTETTFRNDASSRSHAICQIRVENTFLKAAEDGKIFIIDLAGSENASDAQFHNRDLIKETRHINTSLMALKDCIRNRALSAVNLDQYYHIPYRLSKLTLLLKDAFEMESHRHCKTVVFANVSPSVADIGMTLNTLRYVTPLKIGQSNRVKVEPDPNSPAHWDNATLRAWVTEKSNGKIDPEVLCPFESGMQILRIHETEFIRRVMESNKALGEKKAKQFYVMLWKKLIDARVKERKEKLKPKQERQTQEQWLTEYTKIQETMTEEEKEMNRQREKIINERYRKTPYVRIMGMEDHEEGLM